MNKVLFFHSGPGLNSNPDQTMLSTKFKESGLDLLWWNEPSTLRKNGSPYNAEEAFRNYLLSAEDFLLANYQGEQVVLMGHSFGAQAIYYLAIKHPEKIKHLFFIAPNLCVSSTDKNTFRFIIADYKGQNDERANKLSHFLENYSGKFDENTLNGYFLVSENAKLFEYYWFNKVLMKEYLSHYTAPYYTFDFEGFLNVRKSWYDLGSYLINLPATCFYGKHDIVIDYKETALVLNSYFPKVQSYQFEGSSHYPHIEETALFLASIQKEFETPLH